MLTFIVVGAVVAAAVAIGIAFKKHGTLAAVEASAKKELAIVEAALEKADATVVADAKAAIAKLKALF